MKKGSNHTHYVNPEYPVYVVQGTSGALLKTKWGKPAPEWSAKRESLYGYGRITIKPNELKYEYIAAPTGIIVDKWRIIKTKPHDQNLESE